MKNTLVVLMTCHNRKDKTLLCLNKLMDCRLPKPFKSLDIFLVDDGSTDGTSTEISKLYPSVNIIKGNGDLYWNQGMRLAWDTAYKSRPYDFYLWLNDDVVLKTNALTELLESYIEGSNSFGEALIVCGAFMHSEECKEFSYGGRTEQGNVIPNGKIQECKYINGNAVLVPHKIYEKLGNLSPDYTHAMGDFDYGLRALSKGFRCCTTRFYIGICSLNGTPQWSNPEVGLSKRLKLFYSPNGLNFQEYILFRKKFWGNKWVLYAIKAYAKVLFPSIYKFLIR